MNTHEKIITCIVCPRGCKIKVREEEPGKPVMSGYSCKRGKKYATSEYYHPSRLLATTICIKNARIPLIPVRSKEPVPKEKLMEIMDLVATKTVEAPVKMGEVLITNVLDTGVDIVATRSLERIQENKD
ncbi:MAG: DUF1667 domain-containing protein [Candidatus Hodarchaeales archaeon]